MTKYFFVALGAAIGGTFRYWVTTHVYKFLPTYFPFGTLAVNFIGSFLVGLFIFYFDDKGLLNTSLKLFLTIGFCGGLTTYSTFSIETHNLIKESEFLLAGMNIISNTFLSLIAVFIAYLISK